MHDWSSYTTDKKITDKWRSFLTEARIAGIDSDVYPDSLLNMLAPLVQQGAIAQEQAQQLINFVRAATAQNNIVLEAIGGPARDPRMYSSESTWELNSLVDSFGLPAESRSTLDATLNQWAKLNSVRFHPDPQPKEEVPTGKQVLFSQFLALAKEEPELAEVSDEILEKVFERLSGLNDDENVQFVFDNEPEQMQVGESIDVVDVVKFGQREDIGLDQNQIRAVARILLTGFELDPNFLHIRGAPTTLAAMGQLGYTGPTEPEDDYATKDTVKIGRDDETRETVKIGSDEDYETRETVKTGSDEDYETKKTVKIGDDDEESKASQALDWIKKKASDIAPERLPTSEEIELVLDAATVVGIAVPGWGEVIATPASIGSLALNMYQQDWDDALIDVVSLVPLAGKAFKVGAKGGKLAKVLKHGAVAAKIAKKVKKTKSAKNVAAALGKQFAKIPSKHVKQLENIKKFLETLEDIPWFSENTAPLLKKYDEMMRALDDAKRTDPYNVERGDKPDEPRKKSKFGIGPGSMQDVSGLDVSMEEGMLQETLQHWQKLAGIKKSVL